MSANRHAVTAPTRGRREREREARRAAIADAAERLFLERGVAATTMDDIATAAEFSRPAVYNYFADKAAIYVTLVQRHLASVAEAVRTAAQSASRPHDAVEAFTESLIRQMEEHPTFFRLFLLERAAVEPALTRDDREALTDAKAELEDIFRTIYQRGADEGVFRRMHVNDASNLYFAMLTGMAVLHQFYPFRHSLAADMRKCADTMLRALRPD